MSTTPTTQPAARSPYSPTPRDEAIYRAVKIAGHSQTQVAADLGIDQSTVSRALQRFAAWRASTDPQDTGDLSLRQQQRLDRWLAHERHEQIYSQALRFARRMAEPAVTTRQGNSGDKQFSHETKKDQHTAAARFLRTAQRSADALTRLAAQSPIDEEPLEEYTITQALQNLREKAEAQNRVPASGNAYLTIIRWLAALLGRQPPAHPPEILAPGSALGETIRAALSNCFAGTPEDLLRRLADNPPPTTSDDSYDDCDNEDAPEEPATTEQLENSSDHDSPTQPASDPPNTTFDSASSPIPNPQSQIPNSPSPHNCITPRSPSQPQASAPAPARTSRPFSIYEPLPPGARLVKIGDSNDEKNAASMRPEEQEAYPNDPLSRLYRRMEQQRKARRPAPLTPGS